MFKINFDKTLNNLKIFNLSKCSRINSIELPTKTEIELENYDEVLIELGLTVVIPIGDGDDFIFKFNSNSFDSNIIPFSNDFIGKSLMDLYPHCKDVLFYIFNKVIRTHENDKINVYFFEDNLLVNHYEFKLIYNNGEIFIFYNDLSESLNSCHDLLNEINQTDLVYDSDVIKEIHHRVKNNLQIIISFISLGESFSNDNPEKVIIDTKNRINVLSLIYEKMSDGNIYSIHFNPLMKDFNLRLLGMFPRNDVKFFNEIPDDLMFSIDIINPLILLLNELTVNSFKHAFNHNSGNNEIYNSFIPYEKDGESWVKFSYKDNGVGFDDNLENSNNLGMLIIKSLCNQLGGNYNFFNDNGLNFVLNFPINY